MTTAGNVYPLIRVVVALALMTVGGAGMYAAIVALQPVTLEFGVGRGAGSFPYTLFMIGFGFGGVLMGRLADRLGILVPMLIGSVSLPIALFLAGSATSFWQFCLAMGAVGGFLGASPTFAPLIADISHWFTHRRGLAVGVVISGTYVGGAIWPPLLQHFFDLYHWRSTLLGVGLFCLLVMPPLSMLLYRKPPLPPDPTGASEPHLTRLPLGFKPSVLQCLLCAAGIGCCAAMAMPQVHIIPYVSDLGFTAADGARMLALMLGFGIVSRLTSGWMSDRIGGLATLMLGSTLQAAVLLAFLMADGLSALYLTSIAFGLAQGGIVPSYAIIVRRYFVAGDAGWRIGLTFLFTIIGMALGGWTAGALYDLSGSYTLSFLSAIGFNLLNMAIAAVLIVRSQSRRLDAPATQST
jgi:MFS family permease